MTDSTSTALSPEINQQLAAYLAGNPNAIASGSLPNAFTSNQAPQSTQVQPGQPQSGGLGSLIQNASSLTNLATKLPSWLSGSSSASGITGAAAGQSLGLPSLTQGGAFNDAVSSGFGGASTASSAASAAASATSLGSLLGNGLAGAGIGSLLTHFTGGNSLGGTIGGGLGGIVGGIALDGVTTGLGAALGGTALGAEVGSIIPGVGTVIGAVAGSLLGGLFGGHKPNPADAYSGAGLNSDGTFNTTGNSYKTSTSHTTQANINAMQDPFQSYLQKQASTYGIQYGQGLTVNGFYDVNGSWGAGAYPSFGLNANQSANKYAISVGNQAGNMQAFYYNDATSQQKAYQNAFNYISTQSGYDPASLAPVSQTGSNVLIKNDADPDAWQKWLANYRSSQSGV